MASSRINFSAMSDEQFRQYDPATLSEENFLAWSEEDAKRSAKTREAERDAELLASLTKDFENTEKARLARIQQLEIDFQSALAQSIELHAMTRDQRFRKAYELYTAGVEIFEQLESLNTNSSIVRQEFKTTYDNFETAGNLDILNVSLQQLKMDLATTQEAARRQAEEKARLAAECNRLFLGAVSILDSIEASKRPAITYQQLSLLETNKNKEQLQIATQQLEAHKKSIEMEKVLIVYNSAVELLNTFQNPAFRPEITLEQLNQMRDGLNSQGLLDAKAELSQLKVSEHIAEYKALYAEAVSLIDFLPRANIIAYRKKLEGFSNYQNPAKNSQLSSVIADHKAKALASLTPRGKIALDVLTQEGNESSEAIATRKAAFQAALDTKNPLKIWVTLTQLERQAHAARLQMMKSRLLLTNAEGHLARLQTLNTPSQITLEQVKQLLRQKNHAMLRTAEATLRQEVTNAEHRKAQCLQEEKEKVESARRQNERVLLSRQLYVSAVELLKSLSYPQDASITLDQLTSLRETNNKEQLSIALIRLHQDKNSEYFLEYQILYRQALLQLNTISSHLHKNKLDGFSVYESPERNLELKKLIKYFSRILAQESQEQANHLSSLEEKGFGYLNLLAQQATESIDAIAARRAGFQTVLASKNISEIEKAVRKLEQDTVAAVSHNRNCDTLYSNAKSYLARLQELGISSQTTPDELEQLHQQKNLPTLQTTVATLSARIEEEIKKAEATANAAAAKAARLLQEKQVKCNTDLATAKHYYQLLLNTYNIDPSISIETLEQLHSNLDHDALSSASLKLFDEVRTAGAQELAKQKFARCENLHADTKQLLAQLETSATTTKEMLDEFLKTSNEEELGASIRRLNAEVIERKKAVEAKERAEKEARIHQFKSASCHQLYAQAEKHLSALNAGKQATNITLEQLTQLRDSTNEDALYEITRILNDDVKAMKHAALLAEAERIRAEQYAAKLARKKEEEKRIQAEKALVKECADLYSEGLKQLTILAPFETQESITKRLDALEQLRIDKNPNQMSIAIKEVIETSKAAVLKKQQQADKLRQEKETSAKIEKLKPVARNLIKKMFHLVSVIGAQAQFQQLTKLVSESNVSAIEDMIKNLDLVVFRAEQEAAKSKALAAEEAARIAKQEAEERAAVAAAEADLAEKQLILDREKQAAEQTSFEADMNTYDHVKAMVNHLKQDETSSQNPIEIAERRFNAANMLLSILDLNKNEKQERVQALSEIFNTITNPESTSKAIKKALDILEQKRAFLSLLVDTQFITRAAEKALLPEMLAQNAKTQRQEEAAKRKEEKETELQSAIIKSVKLNDYGKESKDDIEAGFSTARTSFTEIEPNEPKPHSYLRFQSATIKTKQTVPFYTANSIIGNCTLFYDGKPFQQLQRQTKQAQTGAASSASAKQKR